MMTAHRQDESVWSRNPPRVGQHATRSRLVSRRDIELFTEISGDREPSSCSSILAFALRSDPAT